MRAQWWCWQQITFNLCEPLIEAIRRPSVHHSNLLHGAKKAPSYAFLLISLDVNQDKQLQAGCGTTQVSECMSHFIASLPR